VVEIIREELVIQSAVKAIGHLLEERHEGKRGEKK